jgi:hypothetical protein
MVKRIATLFAAVTLVAAPIRTASAHPIHMSYTEARYAAPTRMLQLLVRVYANDFAAAAARESKIPLGRDSVLDPAMGAQYLQRHIQLSSADGRGLMITPCGWKRVNDMLLFCVQTAVIGPIAQMRMRNTVMTELFGDQVNVVQTVQGAVRASRLFVRGDGFKDFLRDATR